MTTSTARVTARRDTKVSTVQTTLTNVQQTLRHVEATRTALTRSGRIAACARQDGRERAVTAIRISMSVYFRLRFVGHMARVLTSRGRITARVIGAGVGLTVLTVTASLTGRFVWRIISVLTEPTVHRVSVCRDMTSHVQVWHGKHF